MTSVSSFMRNALKFLTENIVRSKMSHDDDFHRRNTRIAGEFCYNKFNCIAESQGKTYFLTAIFCLLLVHKEMRVNVRKINHIHVYTI